MSSPETEAPTESPADDDAEVAEPETDERREALLDRFTTELGVAVAGSYIRPGAALVVRVDREAWVATGELARDGLGMAFFDFLSVLDWLPSPFGRDMEAEQDWVVHGREAKELPPMETGLAGGDTRFQVFARVQTIPDPVGPDPVGPGPIGVVLKADVPDDDPRIDTWVRVYPGADWHEREAWEMFGLHFEGHPGLRHLYLPGDFQGHPMRKDYPLLARRVKPWPGIVDVELMPGEDDADSGDAAGGDE